MSLKQKTVHGLLWSFIDSFASQGFSFIVGIILARILSPREFGLIGMITIFIAISQSIIDSGFSNALIRKRDCSQADYSTVFIFNIIVSLFFSIILIFSASFISEFFKEPQLKLLIQVLSLGLVINGLSIIHKVILTKKLDFKTQTKISLISSLSSGIFAIIMAVSGYGVWSLVALTISRFALNSLFLWIWAKWNPIWVFSKKSFNELFGFGSKLLISGLIDTIYNNVHYLVIGKFFSAIQLGYYTRADQFQSWPSSNLNNIISRVSYPVLSSIQDEPLRLKENYKKLISTSMFITFVLMLGMASVAEPMIRTLIGDKWLPAVIYLQLLCFVGMLYPLHSLNLNMLQVKGRSDLFLRLEVIKKSLAVPIIIVGVFFGIKIMIIGKLAISIFAYYLNSYYSGRLINYSMKEQIKDILPSFILAFTVSAIVFFFGKVIFFKPGIVLSLQVLLAVVLTIGYCELFKFNVYIFIKQIAFDKLKKNKD